MTKTCSGAGAPPVDGFGQKVCSICGEPRIEITPGGIVTHHEPNRVTTRR